MKTYAQRVEERLASELEPGERVQAAAPVIDTRLMWPALAAAAAGGATGRPWLGALAVLVAFSCLRRTDKATGLKMRAAMVLAVTQHRVIALRATTWNGPRDVLWSVERTKAVLTVCTSRWGSGKATLSTPAGSVAFQVPWLQRHRAAALVTSAPYAARALVTTRTRLDGRSHSRAAGVDGEHAPSDGACLVGH